MSDGTEHKNALDPFSSYLKGRLENHKSPVDPESWDRIAGHLKQRKRLRTGWIASGVAAAVLLAVLWLAIPSGTDTVQEHIAEQKTGTTAPKIETPAINTPAAIPLLSSAAKKKMPAEAIEKETTASEIPQGNSIPRENNIPREENTPQEKSELQEKSGQQEKNERQTETRKQPERSNSEPFLPAELPKKKKSGKWLLAVVTGTGGGNVPNGFPSQGGNGSYASPNPNPVPVPPLLSPPYLGNNQYQNRQYTDIAHAIPVSVGITVRKDINRFFAVETGLLYTYLYSELEKGGIAKSDKLQLHYLGIPLNLVGYMINKPDWNMYVSGGVMLEKGLKSALTVREHVANGLVSTTENYSIPGVQFSLNGAIGLAYRLADHWSLYAEPKLYYYFDANQPPSIRTEHPFGFGINGGIRYHF